MFATGFRKLNSLRSFLAVLMVGAVLALIGHQHSDADSAAHCAASAWHGAALDCAVPEPALPEQPVQAIAIVAPARTLLSQRDPNTSLPRAPPSPIH